MEETKDDRRGGVLAFRTVDVPLEVTCAIPGCEHNTTALALCLIRLSGDGGQVTEGLPHIGRALSLAAGGDGRRSLVVASHLTGRRSLVVASHLTGDARY